MATYDSADLVQRCRDAAQLPADDEMMDDPAWYRLLTAAQAQWYPQMAAHIPQAFYGAPERLESADGGLTYPFGDDLDGRPIIPLGQVQVFRTEADANRPEGAQVWALRPGVDFIAEATQLRMRLTGAAGLFPDGGPWVRMIEPPSAIDATHEPVLLPVHARELLVLGAVEAWATQGGLRDPSPWVGRARKLWSGDPTDPTDTGLLGAIKLQFPSAGRSAYAGGFAGRVPGTYFWGGR